MARQLRIQYPGAVYHITCRGNARQDIYEDNKDRKIFLEILKESQKIYGIKIYSYVLMSNHYHLLLETPKGNVSDYMRHLNMRYTSLGSVSGVVSLSVIVSLTDKDTTPDIIFVTRSIKAKKGLAEPHTLLGYLYIESGETDNAISEFEKSLAIDPSSHDARTGLGSALIDASQHERAIQVLNEALILNPHPERTLYELGRAHEMKGDIDAAADLYRISMEKIAAHHILPSNIGHCR